MFGTQLSRGQNRLRLYSRTDPVAECVLLIKTSATYKDFKYKFNNSSARQVQQFKSIPINCLDFGARKTKIVI